MIAKHIGVSDPFVGSIRKQLLTVSSCDEREGADGRKRTVNEKKKAKTKKERANRSRRSGRMIADHIGVSPTFVGKIRNQLSTVDSCDEVREGADGRKRKVKEKPETSLESDEQGDDTEKDVSENDSETIPESESKKSGGINGLREILSKNDEFENVVDEAIDTSMGNGIGLPMDFTELLLVNLPGVKP